ncbi:MAG: [acyl-carrier-protein] S-malonyltransferase, partial [Clostridiales bacterium]|nr:[acyl-carrier-protein] S-malonyltransferase [Clostridiales bacterium]
TGDFLESDADIRSILKTQVFSSVHFEDDLRRLLESGYDRFIEIGPGNALTGFLKKTSAKLGIKPESICLQTAQDVRKLIEC